MRNKKNRDLLIFLLITLNFVIYKNFNFYYIDLAGGCQPFKISYHE